MHVETKNISNLNSYAIFSDLHVHDYKPFSEPSNVYSTNRIKWTFESLKAVLEYCQSNNIVHVFFLGDLFHSRTLIKLELIYHMYRILQQYASSGMKFYFLPGNHDFALNNNDSPVLFKDWEFIHYIQEPTVFISELNNQRIYAMPFYYDTTNVYKALEMLEKEVPEYTDRNKNILLGHFEVGDIALNEQYVVQTPLPKSAFDSFSFGKVYSGHYHTPQVVTTSRTIITFVGSLIQNTFNDVGNLNRFIVLNIDTEDQNVYTKNLLKVPQFYKIALSSQDDIKALLKEDPEFLTNNYFSLNIFNPDLKIDKLFDKVKFFVTDYDIEPTGMDKLNVVDATTFTVDINTALFDFLSRIKDSIDISWVNNDILTEKLNELTGDISWR